MINILSIVLMINMEQYFCLRMSQSIGKSNSIIIMKVKMKINA